MLFTPDELQTGRLNIFEQIPQGTTLHGNQFPPNHPEEDFDAICLHRPEMMRGKSRTASFFRKMASPYHIWLCGPDATRQTYSKKLAGSRVRDPQAELKDGYRAAFQRVSLNDCGWSLKNDDGGKKVICDDGKIRLMQTNRRGRLIQITLAGWSADSSFTSEADYRFYAYYIAHVAVWLKITNPNGTDFLFDPWQDEGNIGVKHMPAGLWLSPDSKRMMDHGAVPSGNTHWDCGPMDFQHLAEISKEYYERLQQQHEGQPPPISSASVVAEGSAEDDPSSVVAPQSQPQVNLRESEPAADSAADKLAEAQKLIGQAQLKITQYRQETKANG